MLAVPAPTPVTTGCVDGVVAPSGTTTLGVTVTFVVSLLLSETVTPPAGAGAERVMGNGADVPTGTLTPLGNEIVPWDTVTLAVDSAMLAALARIVVVPAPNPVTGTVALVAPAANDTVAGTVATPVLSDLRLTVTPTAGAGADKVNVRF